MSRSNKKISEIIIYVQKNYGEIQICLLDSHIYIYYAYRTFELTTSDELLQALAKFRIMDKPIKWHFDINRRFLKNVFLPKFIENIQNGDSLCMNYNTDVHEHFINLIENTRQFRLEKIYVRFRNKILMDVVEFVSAVTQANIYYAEGESYDGQTFVKFED